MSNICWKEAPPDARVIVMNVLRLRPSRRDVGKKKVWLMLNEIKNGKPIGLISIDPSGKIIDGNTKYFAVKQALQGNGVIPVMVR